MVVFFSNNIPRLFPVLKKKRSCDSEGTQIHRGSSSLVVANQNTYELFINMERRYESRASYKCLFEMLIFVFVRRYPFLFPAKHAFHTNLLAISSSNMCYFLLQRVVKRCVFFISFLSSSKRLYTHSLFGKSIIALL